MSGEHETNASEQAVPSTNRQAAPVPEPASPPDLAATPDNRSLRTEILSLRQDLSALREEYETLEDVFHRVMRRLLVACEYEDGGIESHLHRLSRYCRTIGEKLGLSRTEIDELEWAAPLHDIGNVGVPDRLLLKPGKLNDREFAMIKAHTVIGARLLSDSHGSLLTKAREIALSHHERWDGKGYPAGLKRSDIPLSARIVCIMDNFDALTSERPHKMAYPVDVAYDIIQSQRERIFDPSLLPPLQDCLDKLIKAKADIDQPENMPSYQFTFSERDSLVLDMPA